MAATQNLKLVEKIMKIKLRNKKDLYGNTEMGEGYG